MSGKDSGMEIEITTALSDRPVIGGDSSILTMPPRFYLDVTGDGKPALAVLQLTRFLLDLSHKQANDLGERLHHASFVITQDPEVVLARGLVHDCDECRAGTAAAIQVLRDEPETELLVGMLWWAG